MRLLSISYGTERIFFSLFACERYSWYFALGLAILFEEGLLSKQDYENIKKCQEEAFNTAVELTLKANIERFQADYNGTSFKTEFLGNEIQITQDLIDKNLNHKGHVLAGRKFFSCIKGSEYAKIMKAKGDVQSGATQYSTWGLNDVMRITALYQYLIFLNQNT